ncbi:MAG: DUF6491 family protein [Arenimonas sp.]
MSLRILPIALAALLAAGPAAAAPDEFVIRSTRAQVEAFAGAPVETVARKPLRNYERWETIPDYGVLIWESRTKAWLVDLEREGDKRCADLSSEYLMHLNPGPNWLSSRSGTIELRNGWCEITRIRPVDVRGLRKARKSQGISSPF